MQKSVEVFGKGCKAVLRDGGVKVNNHTSGFGKNIVQSMKEISKEAKELFGKDQEYMDAIEFWQEEIKNDYKERTK